MLTFISEYPNETNIRDGMMQRVAAIDEMVSDCNQIYLDISFKRNFFKRVEILGKATVYHLNIFIHSHLIIRLLKKSNLVYSHSIINLLKVHLFYDPKKTIVDMHGIVPEESCLNRQYFKMWIYNFVESSAIKRAFMVVHVTKSMLKHFESKYKISLESRSIVLPIFEYVKYEFDNRDTRFEQGEKLKIVYAGGLQIWQNIPLMIKGTVDALSEEKFLNTDFVFCLPSTSISSFQQMIGSTLPLDSIEIKSFSKPEMTKFLQTCSLGFVLRDDILINKVACPTKLIEYIQFGVVPIVYSPKIGDFYEIGYKYILLEDFISHRFSSDQLKSYSRHNKKILEKYQNSSCNSFNLIKDTLRGYVS